MTEIERIDFLTGQVSELTAFLSALLSVAPNLEVVRGQYAKVAEVSTAAALNRPVTEAFLQGQARTREDLQKLMVAISLSRTKGASG